MSNVPTTKSYIRFFADDLFSKWGFGDGDMLSDNLDDHLSRGEYSALIRNEHEILNAAVKKFLVPEIEKNGYKLDLAFIGCCHNPTRTRSVNGVQADWYADHAVDTTDGSDIEPGHVDVEIPEIVKFVKENL